MEYLSVRWARTSDRSSVRSCVVLHLVLCSSWLSSLLVDKTRKPELDCNEQRNESCNHVHPFFAAARKELEPSGGGTRSADMASTQEEEETAAFEFFSVKEEDQQQQHARTKGVHQQQQHARTEGVHAGPRQRADLESVGEDSSPKMLSGLESEEDLSPKMLSSALHDQEYICRFCPHVIGLGNQKTGTTAIAHALRFLLQEVGGASPDSMLLSIDTPEIDFIRAHRGRNDSQPLSTWEVCARLRQAESGIAIKKTAGKQLLAKVEEEEAALVSSLENVEKDDKNDVEGDTRWKHEHGDEAATKHEVTKTTQKRSHQRLEADYDVLVPARAKNDDINERTASKRSKKLFSSSTRRFFKTSSLSRQTQSETPRLIAPSATPATPTQHEHRGRGPLLRILKVPSILPHFEIFRKVCPFTRFYMVIRAPMQNARSILDRLAHLGLEVGRNRDSMAGTLMTLQLHDNAFDLYQEFVSKTDLSRQVAVLEAGWARPGVFDVEIPDEALLSVRVDPGRLKRQKELLRIADEEEDRRKSMRMKQQEQQLELVSKKATTGTTSRTRASTSDDEDNLQHQDAQEDNKNTKNNHNREQTPSPSSEVQVIDILAEHRTLKKKSQVALMSQYDLRDVQLRFDLETQGRIKWNNFVQKFARRHMGVDTSQPLNCRSYQDMVNAVYHPAWRNIANESRTSVLYDLVQEGAEEHMHAGVAEKPLYSCLSAFLGRWMQFVRPMLKLARTSSSSTYGMNYHEKNAEEVGSSTSSLFQLADNVKLVQINDINVKTENDVEDQSNNYNYVEIPPENTINVIRYEDFRRSPSDTIFALANALGLLRSNSSSSSGIDHRIRRLGYSTISSVSRETTVEQDPTSAQTHDHDRLKSSLTTHEGVPPTSVQTYEDEPFLTTHEVPFQALRSTRFHDPIEAFRKRLRIITPELARRSESFQHAAGIQLQPRGWGHGKPLKQLFSENDCRKWHSVGRKARELSAAAKLFGYDVFLDEEDGTCREEVLPL
ncbi:unnamed protein product [Amoebophrya sp. A25]|nr:unnamed protein product [Amoebophrya sp. A25]|eukprot:GSA25T00014562001.1